MEDDEFGYHAVLSRYENDWIGLIDWIDALVIFEKQIWNVRITLQKL